MWRVFSRELTKPMSLTITFLAPMALLVQSPDNAAQSAMPTNAVPAAAHSGEAADPVSGERVADSFANLPVTFVVYQAQPARRGQVRIEATSRIRISPQPRVQSPQTRPDMLVSLPQRAIGASFNEKRIGRCLPVSSIAGVQPNGASDLILYMRDRRMVRAQLERSCRAREFYSGFYISGGDGKLCVDRDMLQSRSGTNCKLAEIRQLVETGD
jgi:hypothetical protein